MCKLWRGVRCKLIPVSRERERFRNYKITVFGFVVGVVLIGKASGD